MDASSRDPRHRQQVRKTRERRGGTSEPLLIGRQPLLQRRRDIDVRVQRVDERRRDLIADFVVGDELLCGALDRFGIEALEADVAGQKAQKGQEDAEPGQDASDGHSHVPLIALCDGVSITPMG